MDLRRHLPCLADAASAGGCWLSQQASQNWSGMRSSHRQSLSGRLRSPCHLTSVSQAVRRPSPALPHRQLEVPGSSKGLLAQHQASEPLPLNSSTYNPTKYKRASNSELFSRSEEPGGGEGRGAPPPGDHPLQVGCQRGEGARLGTSLASFGVQNARIPGEGR